VYGCEQDEAEVFREVAPYFGVTPTITDRAVSEANVERARGNRCVSVGHKTHVTNFTLLALSRAGVRYVSTRSIGCNHIDVSYAESVGICLTDLGRGLLPFQAAIREWGEAHLGAIRAARERYDHDHQ
jgi:D-specific alpha-keto acid dehydrogenase